ncbi:hypothetical protein Kalk_08350 [Ketobacter alkanivorans]|uniref:PA14 domain-containing protein n=1 Tax=Ketobacter alkanivorans TaxID=1917421 RepID=A0A2K9LJM2_9GAMM|nr:hypothetical protein Kalk_08350 [Ketobacter alkanivorans]
MWRASVRLIALIVCMLTNSAAWAADCGSIWPAATTPGSSNAPVLPTFTGAAPLTLNNTLGPGDYHYSTTNLSGGTLTTGGTTTRLYFNGGLQLSGTSSLNASGNPEDLIVIVNGNFQMSGQARVNALIYVTGNATVNGSSSVQINGALTAAGSISVGGGASVNYDSSAVDDADYGSLCSIAPPRLLLVSPVCGSSNRIIVDFDSANGQQFLDLVTSENTANYSVVNQSGGSVTVQSAVRSDEGYQVQLTLGSNMSNNTNYTVTVSNVQDATGEVIGVSNDTFYYTTQQNGMAASYWGNETLSGGYQFQRVDSNIAFDWGIFTWPAGSFFSGFSIRWEGYIEPDVSGNYVFRSTSEDGSRVWLGDLANTQIINRWSAGRATANSSTIALVAGQRYPLKVEFYKEGVAFSSKTMHLQWQGPSGGSFVDVPNANLYTCVDSFASSTGLVAYYKLEGPTWNGTVGEVLDSSYNRLHGTGVNNPQSVPAQVCNGAQLDGSNLIRVNDNPLLDLTNELAITAWIRLDAYGPDNLKSIFSKDENYEFHINNSGQIFWWWQSTRSGTTTRSFDSGASRITLGNWHHVAIVYSQTRQSIYLDGAEVAFRTYSGETLVTNSDPMEIGADQGITGRRWRGLIDEVKLYDRSLSGAEVLADMNATNPCASILDGFEVTAAATASVCAPTEVTIRALAADGTTYTGFTGPVDISTSSNHGNWSSSGFGTLIPSTDSNDDGAVQYSFAAGDNGQVVLNLSNTHADELTVTATESGGTATGVSSVIAFNENALQINVTDTLGNDFIAGRNHALEVEMLRLDPVSGSCGRFEEYQGDIDLKAWITRSANDAGGVAPEVTGVSLPSATPGADNLTLNFVQGLASTQLLTSDVGQYALNLTDDSSGLVLDINNQPITINASSADYTVRPFAFYLLATTQRATPTNNPAATSAAGSAFIKAGETFDLMARAVVHQGVDDSDDDGVADAGADLSDNAATPAFGNEGESVSLSSTLLLPSPSLAGVVDPGLAGATTISAFSSGAGTASVRFDEVGIIQLDAQLQSGSYLGSSNVTGAIDYVGRFYPDQFLISDDGPQLRDGNDDVSPWTCDFTYQGQGFGFVSEPSITVTAVNVLGATANNYGGAFWSLPLPQHTIELDSASPATGSACLDGVGGIAAGCFTENSSSVTRSWTGADIYDGAAVFSTTAHQFVINKLNDQPDSGDVPWDPLLDYSISSADLTVTETLGAGVTDDVCYQSGGCAAYLIDDIQGTNLRYGRGWIDNTHGSVQTPLIMMLRLQYWDSTGNFVNNSADNGVCLGTVVADTDFGLSAFSGNLDAGETSIAGVSSAAGYSLVSLAAPGYDGSANPNSGSATLTWILDTDTTDNTPGEECGEHWLCYDYNGDGLRQNPYGQAIFGDLSDNKPVLFLRESYR